MKNKKKTIKHKKLVPIVPLTKRKNRKPKKRPRRKRAMIGPPLTKEEKRLEMAMRLMYKTYILCMDFIYQTEKDEFTYWLLDHSDRIRTEQKLIEKLRIAFPVQQEADPNAAQA